MLTPELLQACGEMLHGADVWKKPLSRDLGVHERTMHRWARGQFGIPQGIAVELARLLESRRDDAADLIRRLTT